MSLQETATTTNDTNTGASNTGDTGRSALLGDGGAPAAPTTQANTQGRADNQGHNSGGAFDANGDWRSGFATGLDDQTKQTWDSLSGRYTSPAELAKAHVNLVQTMDKRIPIPAADAKPEEWDAVYQKLGMPEKPDAYQWKFEGIENWDDGRRAQVKELAPLFHKARATQAQVDEFVRQQAELDKVSADAERAKANQLQMERTKALQTEWRGEFDKNKGLVATTVKTYAGNDFEEIASLRLSDGTFAADHPAFARMFARIGAERAEDDRDPSAFNTGARESAQEQINQIEQEAIAKGWSPTHPQWPHKKLDALYAKTAGSKNMFNHA
jgi:hypothetical protein